RRRMVDDRHAFQQFVGELLGGAAGDLLGVDFDSGALPALDLDAPVDVGDGHFSGLGERVASRPGIGGLCLEWPDGESTGSRGDGERKRRGNRETARRTPLRCVTHDASGRTYAARSVSVQLY